MRPYDFQKIEKKWAGRWLEDKIYEPDLTKAKKPFYNLMMFPYLSAEGLHVGNMYAFTGSDIYGRFMRMRGKDVFEPIGLDGFGIHSENYALKIGVHPMEQAKISEKRFYGQLKMIGNGFSWSNRLETYNPDYYRWTQWIFLKLFEKGLAYRKKAPVNWCPSCKTVLADEQVIDNKCERCDSEVIKKNLEQWFFKITDYADRLLKNLDKIDWPERIKAAQRNWIGKSEGALIKFPLSQKNAERTRKYAEKKQRGAFVEVFTTRPDTIFGATFLALAPEHPFIKEAAESIHNIEEVKKYATAAKRKSEVERISEVSEKTGVELKGVRAINPATKKEIPIWVSDYVLSGYGTGAIMAVPAHDKRDFEFAKKFGLPIVESPLVSFEKAIKETGGEKTVQYRLRDWLISRQRYWGPPIPLIFCETCERKARIYAEQNADKRRCISANPRSNPRKSAFSRGELENPGWIAVPEKDLPVKLPYLENFRPSGKGESPLASSEKFYKVRCPRCKKWARRETDVSDTFLDSAWYFLRYPSTLLGASPLTSLGASPLTSLGINPIDLLLKTGLSRSVSSTRLPWNAKITKKWLPVNMYVGGAEHAVLHLLYSRFITMFFKKNKLIDFEEPFTTFRINGLILKEGSKMSKSKGNVVNPDEYIKKFGADTLRLHLMFLGPFEEGGDFRDEAIAGITRFLGRAWTLGIDLAEKETKKEISQTKLKTRAPFLADFHFSIKKITNDIADLRYNTAISELMIILNRFTESAEKVTPEDFEIFLRLLAPFAPFIAEELWSRLGYSKSIHLAPWPKYDEKLLERKTFELVVQINGRVRDKFEAGAGIKKEEAEKLALERKKIKDLTAGKKIQKTIFIPGKLLNIVI